MNLQSSTQKLGKYVTQIWHFSGGQKRTFNSIDTTTIKDGSMCKMMTKDGRMLMVNTSNVDMIEVFSEDNTIDKTNSDEVKPDEVLSIFKVKSDEGYDI